MSADVNHDLVVKVTRLPILEEVRLRVCQIHPYSDIARFIQSQGYYTEDELPTVIEWVKHYARTIPTTAKLQVSNPGRVASLNKAVNKSLSVLDEKIWLHDMQKKRLQKFEQTEQGLAGLPLKDLTDNIEITDKLLTSIFETQKYLGKTGADSDTPNDVQASDYDMDGIYDKPGMNKALQDPASRTRIMGAVQRFIELAQSPAPKTQEIITENQIKDVTPEKKNDEVVTIDQEVVTVESEIDLQDIELVAPEEP